MPLVSVRTLLVHDEAFLHVQPQRDSEIRQVGSVADIAGRHNEWFLRDMDWPLPDPAARAVTSYNTDRYRAVSPTRGVTISSQALSLGLYPNVDETEVYQGPIHKAEQN